MPTTVKPLLWKIRRNHVHMLGTMHLGPDGGFDLGSKFAEILDATESVVLEIGPQDKAFDPAILRRTASNLELELGPDLYGHLRADPRYADSFEAIKPAAVIIQLALGLYTDIGLRPENGVDSQLEQKAIALKKCTTGFETATEQLEAILLLDNPEVKRAFEYMLLNPGLMHKIRDLVILSFIEGNEIGVEAARTLSGQWSAAFAAKLLYEREARWLPRILTMVEGDTSTLIAVGAIHLVGPNGLIRKLTEAGLPVDRLG